MCNYKTTPNTKTSLGALKYKGLKNPIFLGYPTYIMEPKIQDPKLMKPYSNMYKDKWVHT